MDTLLRLLPFVSTTTLVRAAAAGGAAVMAGFTDVEAQMMSGAAAAVWVILLCIMVQNLARNSFGGSIFYFLPYWVYGILSTGIIV